ncbi:hypothetical protein GCM10022255_108950 [Dactylosporangium darangshiense]|uniref:Chromosome partition protein Smc n=1 Tax=Dactylosporangium darangshiense TaxID=579108 RepID=A0ABP8DUA4_9ACTN
MRINAQAWRQLGAGLREHSDRALKAIHNSWDRWQGAAGNEFRNAARRVAEFASQLSEVSFAVAERQDRHADDQKRVADVLKELAIQIAATLTMWTVAAFFPALLAAVEAYLNLLIVQVGRILAVLARMLRELVSFLIRVRTWIVQMTKLTWQTEKFMIGYGRILYEGVRDGVGDLLSNVIATKISKQPLDPALLFVSAGASAVTGGLVGLVEGAGVKKVVDEAGRVRRASNGLPTFSSNVERFRRAVRDLGGHREQTAANAAPVPARVTAETARNLRAVDRVLVTHAEARALGVDLTAKGGRRLEERLTIARNVQRRVLEGYLAAAEWERSLRSRLGTLRTEYDNALADVQKTRSDLAVQRERVEAARLTGDKTLLRNEHRGLAAAATKHETTSAAAQSRWQRLALAQETQHMARAEAARLEKQFDDATEHLKDVTQRTEVRHRLVSRIEDAVAEIKKGTSWAERIAYVKQHSSWREGYPTAYESIPSADRTVLRPVEWQRQHLPLLGEHPVKGYGKPKEWREFIIHNGIKGIAKGAVSNVVITAYEYAVGDRSAEAIWREMLLGAAFGTVRGFVDGAGINRTFFQGSMEEILWRAASKSLDRFIRGQLSPYIEHDESD